MAFVEALDIQRSFDAPDQRIEALKPLSVTIESGEYVMITGESGAGKSTLLSLIGALDRPTGGRMLVDGADIGGMNPSDLARFRLQHVGFVFQDFCLVRHLTALGNVRLPLLFAKRLHNGAAAETLLHRFNMGHRLHQRPSALSRGELQRVALARALVNNPKLLLADEPTANLDARNARVVWDHLAELNANDGLTVIVVTHDRHAAPGATRRLTLDDGQLVDDAPI